MATPKSPDSFPLAFQLILERFKDSNAPPLLMHYPRAEDAARIRFTFYSFKKALGKAGRVDDVRVANGILIRLINDTSPAAGASLEFSLRDNLAWALDLERALQETAGAPPLHTAPLTQGRSEASSDDMVNQYLVGKK